MLQLGQDDERTVKEVETIKRSLQIYLYSKEQSGRGREGEGRWGKVEDWIRLRDIEMRMVIRARVMLLSLVFCW